MPRTFTPEQRESAKERSRKWYEANKEKANASSAAWYIENHEHAKALGRAYAAGHREEAIARVKAWQKANPDRVAAQRAKPETRDKARKRVREWVAANPERKRAQDEAYYQQNSDTVRAAAKAYRKANPGKVLEVDTRKKVGVKQRTPKWLTGEDWAAIRAVYEEAARLTRETGEVWHVDHIVPLRGKLVSGLHVPGNLQVLPAAVNMKKKNKFDPDQHLGALAPR